VSDDLLAQIEQLQQTILQTYPEAKFRFSGSEHGDIYHLAIYHGGGTLQMPVNVARELNLIWQNHRLTVITTVYPMAHYKEN
jgi:hypothetical protein